MTKSNAKEAQGNPGTAFHTRMWGAQALAPLYRAVLVRPGIQASHQVFQQALEEVKRLYKTALDEVYRRSEGTGSDVNPRAYLAAAVAEMVAEAWQLADFTSAPTIQSPEIERIIETFEQLGSLWDSDFPRKDVPETDSVLSTDTRESMAELSATCTACAGLLQVWVLQPATQRLYVSDQRPADLIRLVRVTLSDCADEIVDQVTADASPAERVSVYCAVLEVLGGLYRSTLDALFVELSRQIHRMNAHEQREYLEGLSHHVIGHLMERTQELFTALVPCCYPSFDPVGELFQSGEHPDSSKADSALTDSDAVEASRAGSPVSTFDAAHWVADVDFDRHDW